MRILGEMDNFENKRLNIWDTHMHCEIEPSFKKFVNKRLELDKIGCLSWAYFSIRNLFDSPLTFPHSLEFVESDEYREEDLHEGKDCYKMPSYRMDGIFCIIAIIWFLAAFVGGIIGARSYGWEGREIRSLENPIGIICDICSLLCLTIMSASQFRNSRFLMSLVYIVGAINITTAFTLFGIFDGLVYLSSLFGALLMVGLYGITFIAMIFKETRARAYFVNTLILMAFHQLVMPVVMTLVKKPFGFKFVIVATVVIVVFRMIIFSDPKIHIRNTQSSNKPRSYTSNTTMTYNNGSDNNTSYTSSDDTTYDYMKEYEKNREQQRIEDERRDINREIDKKSRRRDVLIDEVKGHKRQIEGFYKNQIGALGVDVKAQERKIAEKEKDIEYLNKEINKLREKLR